MESPFVEDAHHVEEERISIVVQGLMVEKQFGQKAKVLSVIFVLPAVDFKEGDVLFSVDLVARWMADVAFGQMPHQALATFAIFQAKLANVNAR